jgi:hypothetical protein
MKRVVPWLDVVDMASRLVPEPAGAAIRIASAIARALTEEGCDVDGCPADVLDTLQPADIPTGEAGLAARQRAIARSKGLDARGLRERALAVAARKGEALRSKVEQVLDEAERTS